MQTTTEIRDVSGIELPPRIRWGEKLIVCPHCHRATPQTEAWMGGRWQAFMPYPCDCEGYRAQVARIERRESERQQGQPVQVPERFTEAVPGIDASELAETIKQGCGVYLHGGNGTGKTTMAYAIASRLASEGWSTEVTTLAAIKSDMHDTWSSDESQRAIIGRLSRRDLLVLDDLGKEVPSESTAELLFRIVNERYERRRNVVITSNYSRGELAARLAKGCDEATAAAIASRLKEMTVSIAMDGPDGRCAA